MRVVESSCSADMELITLTFRPEYLSRKFGQLTLVLVYISPYGNVTLASETVASYVNRLEIVSLPTLPATRRDKTIDLCYGKVKDAYRAYKKPPPSTADHDVVPVYCTKLQICVVKKQVQKWGIGVQQFFQSCFDNTLLDVLTEGKSLEATDVVTSYTILFTEILVPIKKQSVSKQ